jgi:hypothetical protein
MQSGIESARRDSENVVHADLIVDRVDERAGAAAIRHDVRRPVV